MRTLLQQLFICTFCMWSLHVAAQSQPSGHIRGKVTCRGNGVSGVVVTDGFGNVYKQKIQK